MKLIRTYLRKLHHLYSKYIGGRRREPRFLVLLSFTVTFIVARFIVYGITYHLLPHFPFSYIFYKDVHIHHLVFGIILLLIAGFIRIPELSNNLVRISSVLYGVGAALTLDEFAIWLKLNPDAYFGSEGRISIDAVVLFILLFLFSWWYGNFVKKLLLFTLSFLGIYRPNKHRRKKKPSLLKRWFAYLGLGVLTFFAVNLYYHPIHFSQAQTYDVEHAQAAPIFGNDFAMHYPDGFPTDTITPPAVTLGSSLVSASPTASPSSDFCLRVPVLMYHHVQPYNQAEERGQLSLNVDTSVFDQQMQYLTEHGYTTISAETLLTALRDHTYLSPKTIVVTLDDGYEDNYTDAFPVAKKYHVILNLMVAAGLVGTHFATNYYYTWDQLREMVNSGLVYAYDHTWSHWPVGIGSVEKNQFEILTAKNQLQQNLSRSIDVFTYPYGYGIDMQWVKDLLQEDGFIGAFSTVEGTLQCQSNIMSLPRTRIGSEYFPNFGIN